MSLSKKIIEMHHGTLSCNSDGESKGSTFTIALPCYSSIMESASNGCQLNNSILEISDHNQPSLNLLGVTNALTSFNPLPILSIKRVLVVDDSDLSRRVLNRHISNLRNDIEVEEANDGKVALELMSEALNIQEESGEQYYSLVHFMSLLIRYLMNRLNLSYVYTL